MTSEGGGNISDTLPCTSYATFLSSPDFDIICDIFLNRCTYSQMEAKKECSLIHQCSVKTNIITTGNQRMADTITKDPEFNISKQPKLQD